jgi:pyridoxal phosphate enzyme (YggS family)
VGSFNTLPSISQNIESIRARIAAAARRARRNPHEIAFMAVTKTVEPARIREAWQAGIRLFGENRVQEFARKGADLIDLDGAEWRLVGHLQTNKAAQAVELFVGIDSVDSLRLAEKLNAAAQKLNHRLAVFIEVNIGGEESKSGLAPESPDFEALLAAAPQLDHLRIRGLMAIPPFGEDAESSRPYFRRLRELRERIAARHLPAIEMSELSMGMSHDFEIAIEEGSTCVRIGTAIFGERPKP